MAELKLLPTYPRECVEDAREHVERLLERVKSGDVTSVAYATTHADGSIGTGWSKTADYGRLLGGVTRLQGKISSS